MDTKPPAVSVESEQKARPNAGGRPGYKPTAEARAIVVEMVGKDATRAEIAKRLEVSPVTLRKHFAAELGERRSADDGQLELTAAAAGAPPPPVGKPGAPPFEPDYVQKQEVILAKADNWSDERIASYLGISRNTLLKHFADELNRGADRLRMQLLKNLKAASAKSPVAAEKMLKLPGMVAPLEKLPTPEPEQPEPQLGQKAQRDRDAQTAHQGNSWGDLVKH